MIKHVVMWKLKEVSNGKSKLENAKTIKEMLEALPAKISQIKQLEVGISVKAADNSVTDFDYDACLVTLFDSLEDLDIYQNHPDHKAVSAFVATVREGRCVVDYIV